MTNYTYPHTKSTTAYSNPVKNTTVYTYPTEQVDTLTLLIDSTYSFLIDGIYKLLIGGSGRVETVYTYQTKN